MKVWSMIKRMPLAKNSHRRECVAALHKVCQIGMGLTPHIGQLPHPQTFPGLEIIGQRGAGTFVVNRDANRIRNASQPPKILLMACDDEFNTRGRVFLAHSGGLNVGSTG